MKIKIEQLNERIDLFATGVLVPNAKNPMTKFKIGFLRGATGNGIKLPPEYEDGLRTLGVLDDAGCVDLDALRKAMFAGLDLAGTLPIAPLGITLDRSDLERGFHVLETGKVD